MSLLSRKVDLKFVKKAYLIKFGNAYILPKKEVDDKFLMDQLIECLSSSPLITAVYHLVPPGGPQRLSVFRTYRYATFFALNFMPYVGCRFNLPVKNQNVSEIFEAFVSSKAIDYTSTFDLLYNGSIYLISRKVDLSKVFHPGAPDIRDEFKAILSKEELWEVRQVAPNPLREDIFLVFIEETEETSKFVGKMFLEKGRLYLYLSKTLLKQYKQIMSSLLRSSSYILDMYYTAVTARELVDQYRRELEKIHTSIRKILGEFEKIPFFDIYNHFKKSRELERLISRHYSCLLDYSSAIEQLREDSERVRNLLRESYLLRYFQKRLMKEIEYRKIDVDTLTKCASYAREITQRSYTTKITLVAALLTVIGSIIGSVLISLL